MKDLSIFKVKAFKKDRDFELLAKWWEYHGHPVVGSDELPETGFMVYVEDEPILCAFLVLTNAKFALMETVCACPEIGPTYRENAIIVVTEAISNAAKELGFRRLLAFPQKKRLAQKGIAAGWLKSKGKYFGMVKEL